MRLTVGQGQDFVLPRRILPGSGETGTLVSSMVLWQVYLICLRTAWGGKEQHLPRCFHVYAQEHLSHRPCDYPLWMNEDI